MNPRYTLVCVLYGNPVDDTALLRQALEALELNLGYGPEKTIEQTHSVITTLRERLGEKT